MSSIVGQSAQVELWLPAANFVFKERLKNLPLSA
jgi:hypothetical protein